MARELRLALVGFGRVGQRFVEQLRGHYRRVLRAEGVAIRVTGIATGRRGLAVGARGLDLASALRRARGGRSLSPLPRGRALDSVRRFVAEVPADADRADAARPAARRARHHPRAAGQDAAGTASSSSAPTPRPRSRPCRTPRSSRAPTRSSTR